MADALPQLTPEQSAARERELIAQGYSVVRETQPDGSIIVKAGKMSLDVGWAIVLLVGLAGCFDWQRSRGGGGSWL